MSFLIHSVSILKGGRALSWIDTGFVIVKNGKFTEVKEGTPSQEHIESVDEVIDGKGKWLLPGLVNTHGHKGMSLLRGYSDDLPLDRWLKEQMWPFEAKLDAKSVAVARELAMVEMIRSGTTTFLEMYHLTMPEFAERIEEVGMRAALTRSMIGLCSKEEQNAKLNESVDFVNSWNDKANGRIKTMYAPHAPYTCPPDFILKIVDEAEKSNVPIHMHIAETAKEVKEHVEKYGKHPIEHLEEMGVLDRVKWIFAHSVHVNDSQMDLLKKFNIGVSHNPISNLKLGSGVAPVPVMLEKGIEVGIGTDSVASNNTLDMIEEMRMAALIHKGVAENPTKIPVEAAIQMATSIGARMIGFKDTGSIDVDYQADFILMESQVAHLQPYTNPISHFVYASKGSDISDVFVSGKQLMKNRELLTIDEEKMMYEVNKEYKRIESSVH